MPLSVRPGIGPASTLFFVGRHTSQYQWAPVSSTSFIDFLLLPPRNGKTFFTKDPRDLLKIWICFIKPVGASIIKIFSNTL